MGGGAETSVLIDPGSRPAARWRCGCEDAGLLERRICCSMYAAPSWRRGGSGFCKVIDLAQGQGSRQAHRGGRSDVGWLFLYSPTAITSRHAHGRRAARYVHELRSTWTSMPTPALAYAGAGRGACEIWGVVYSAVRRGQRHHVRLAADSATRWLARSSLRQWTKGHGITLLPSRGVKPHSFRLHQTRRAHSETA